MRCYESETLCINCGYTYGEHRWDDDACPVKSEQNYPADFVEGSFFILERIDEGGKE